MVLDRTLWRKLDTHVPENKGVVVCFVSYEWTCSKMKHLVLVIDGEKEIKDHQKLN